MQLAQKKNPAPVKDGLPLPWGRYRDNAMLTGENLALTPTVAIDDLLGAQSKTSAGLSSNGLSCGVNVGAGRGAHLLGQSRPWTSAGGAVASTAVNGSMIVY